MRAFQQKKILELLLTLNEANNELKKQHLPEVLCGLLGEIQEFAFQIGNYIESVAGEDTRTVALLEEFCATIYEAYNDKSAVNYIKRIKAQMIGIENSVHTELKPNRIEMAFFPYKASMADSLQTVWEAATADPDCDAVICPIPYFDRKPDGTLGRMHYEGDDYPNNLPITNWQDYDVKAQHPDVIFIMNPYDDGNYVTTVHPDFYSERLRTCTDLLVYIPYFVVGDDVPEHFCSTAGCAYAHKVILQSEKVYNTYVRVYKGTFGNRFGKPKDKFVILGSPKFDRVLSTSRNDYELPDAWAEIIAGKQVVLYNTSIAAMLQDSNQYLENLRAVLDIFRKRDDVVLWWRPHPLLESTFETMRPELLGEYRQILEHVLQPKLMSEHEKAEHRGFIIYDDSSDLHRAIAVSDCLISDISSVTVLYKMTGKPIMFIRSKPDNQLRLVKGVFENNYAYLTFVNFNAICVVDLSSGQIDILRLDFDEPFHKRALHSIALKQKELLYLLPHSSPNLIVYDMQMEKHTVYKCSEEYSENYGNHYLYKNKMFLLPVFRPDIAVFDMDKQTLEIYKIDINDFEKLGIQFKTEEQFYIISTCTVENRIFLVGVNPNIVIEFDTESNTFTYHTQLTDVMSMCFDGTFFWIARKEKLIVKSNLINLDQDQVFALPAEFESSEDYPLCVARYINGKVVYISWNANMILRIDAESNSIDGICLPEIENADFQSECVVGCTFLGSDDTYLYLFSRKQTVIIKSDVSANTYEIIPLNFKKEHFELLFGEEANFPFGKSDDYEKGNYPTVELNSLGFHINYLPYKFPVSANRKNGGNGKRIYDYVKRIINVP